MGRSFPVILTELRKEKGVSQKDAAAALGVSQALLSHYEKGIRECSYDFYNRAADYYDVTCDYLFGRTESKSGEVETYQFGESAVEDAKLTDMTVFRAALELRESLRKGLSRAGVDYRTYLSLSLYRLIVQEANAGDIPKSWTSGEDWKYYGPVFLNILSAASATVIRPDGKFKPDESAPVPLCIKTVADHAHTYLLRTVADNVPPIPDEYRK